MWRHRGPARAKVLRRDVRYRRRSGVQCGSAMTDAARLSDAQAGAARPRSSSSITSRRTRREAQPRRTHPALHRTKTPPSARRKSRLSETSNDNCLPGRAGGTPSRIRWTDACSLSSADRQLRKHRYPSSATRLWLEGNLDLGVAARGRGRNSGGDAVGMFSNAGPLGAARQNHQGGTVNPQILLIADWLAFVRDITLRGRCGTV